MKNVVVMGGGTGTYTILSGIKSIPDVNITAIVSSSDSGGSTGVLRDHFGQLPMGDYRQCLVALASDENGDNLLRELFQYRFDKGGEGLEGHNFGNLILTALSDILGSEELAFRKASRILNIQGRVFPITYDNVQLVAEYEDGSILYGEAGIDEPPESHDGKLCIKKLWTDPEAVISLRAEEALENADYIIAGPGDLYTSTLANVVVNGVPTILQKSNASLIYIINLVSKWGQTNEFKASNYINEIEKYSGVKVNHILINTGEIPEEAIRAYEKENSHPVQDDLGSDNRVLRKDFLFEGTFSRKKNDKVKRSLLRHDSKKIADVLSQIIH